MSATLRLPSTAPFPADRIELLNRALSDSDALQRSWLSGFLAGIETVTVPALPANGVSPSVPPRVSAPLLIAYATDSGNSEALAFEARKLAVSRGFAPRVADMADIAVADAAAAANLLVIASTWGEGDPPERAVDFYNALFADDAPSFGGVSFSVLALGDRAYVNFCETGRRIDERLAALGGHRAAARVDCDLDYEGAAAEWLDGALEALKPESEEGAENGTVVHLAFPPSEPAASAWSKSSPFEAEITELVNLNGSRSEKATWHAELSLEGAGLVYEPGDAIGIVPENDPAEVDAVLAAARMQGDDELRAALARCFEITRLTPPVVEAYAALCGDATLREVAAGPALADFMAERHLADLLAEFPADLGPEQLLSFLRPLPPRLYSVASSLKATPGEAHLLVGEVRYELRDRTRRGVASSLVGLRRKMGDRLRIYHKPNRHFRLPADADAPIVMIGPGTGVAPFRAFVQEREATGARGRSWLFFGDRRYTHDFLYQLEWQDALKSGALTHLDLAFSRDQPERVYVQHRMWERRAELDAWLREGACLYVCGDEKRMAKDVHAMLARILMDRRELDAEAAEAELAELRRAGRYLRDVY